jgi:hypothetical protein
LPSKQLHFRGATIRAWNGTQREGIMVQRVRVACDVTRTVAEEMGWDDLLFASERELRTGAKRIPLTGELGIEAFKLTPDGMAQHAIELLATEARDFEVSFSGGGDEDEPSKSDAEMRFTVVLADTASLATIENYMRIAGKAAAKLRVTVKGDNQMKLGEDAPAVGDEPESDDEPMAPEPPLASVVNMGERSRPRGAKPGVQ